MVTTLAVMSVLTSCSNVDGPRISAGAIALIPVSMEASANGSSGGFTGLEVSVWMPGPLIGTSTIETAVAWGDDANALTMLNLGVDLFAPWFMLAGPSDMGEDSWMIVKPVIGCWWLAGASDILFGLKLGHGDIEGNAPLFTFEFGWILLKNMEDGENSNFLTISGAYYF
jgi:hypothetical protein